MQELSSPTFLTTIFSTALALAMAAIFFCCWGKRNSYDAGDATAKSAKDTDRNSTKKSSSGEDSAAEKSISATDSQKPGENGVPSEVKSTVGIVVDGSDLGDFSAVSREQEILRSYRKPPPPKNRARQSRAPRAAFKSSTENLDIFTELTEESSSFNLRLPGEVNGEDTASADGTTEVDSGSLLLRPRSAHSDVSSSSAKREDVRSSMLADIEQTLAALHLNKAEETPEDTSSKDTARNGKDDDDVGDEALCVQDKVAAVSSQPNSRLAESVTEHDDVSSAKSPPGNQSPLTKPKIGPKVSPKPALKKKFLTPQQLSAEETKESDDLVLKTENATSSASHVTKVPTSGGELENGSKSNIAEVSSAAETDSSGQRERLNDANAPCKEAAEEQAPAAAKDAKESSIETGQETDSSEVTPAPDGESERPESGEASSKPSISLKSEVVAAAEAADVPTPPPANGSASDSDLQPSAGEDGTPVTTSTTPADGAEEASSKEEISKPAADPDTAAKQQEPHAKGAVQQHDSAAEEQTGKTKISKIPVRAGSKPRSSPPKIEKQESGGN